MIEINPLITTSSGEVKAIDAKMSIDDSELFRRPALVEYRDLSAEPAAEAKAREADLSYVKLDGNVGCCVNGAGLAMATMDLGEVLRRRACQLSRYWRLVESGEGRLRAGDQSRRIRM